MVRSYGISIFSVNMGILGSEYDMANGAEKGRS